MKRVNCFCRFKNLSKGSFALQSSPVLMEKLSSMAVYSGMVVVRCWAEPCVSLFLQSASLINAGSRKHRMATLNSNFTWKSKGYGSANVASLCSGWTWLLNRSTERETLGLCFWWFPLWKPWGWRWICQRMDTNSIDSLIGFIRFCCGVLFFLSNRVELLMEDFYQRALTVLWTEPYTV